MNNKKLVHVGTFGKPQGLKGELKINIFTSSLEFFKLLNQYFMDDGESKWNFISLKKIGKKYVASLQGCEDRDAALLLKGKYIFSFRENFPPTKEDQYYSLDLIDCTVVNINNKVLGIVINIKNFGAGDLLEIKDHNQKIFYIPMNEQNLVNVNILKKIIMINPIPGLID